MLDKARVIGYIPMERQKVKTRMSMLLGKVMSSISSTMPPLCSKQSQTSCFVRLPIKM